jgi:hypothetical protein
MKKKVILIGITSILLVFGLILGGCNNGTTDPPSNPLEGAWYNGGQNPNQPNNLVIFSNPGSDGRQFFYGLWNLFLENNTDTSGKQVYISGQSYVYSQTGNTLTVYDYIDNQGNTANVDFTRIEGSSKTDEHDVWYTPNRTDANQYRTILVIKSSNITFTAVGPGGKNNNNSNWDRWEYTPDSGNNRVNWVATNDTASYALDGTTLTSSALPGTTYTQTNL